MTDRPKSKPRRKAAAPGGAPLDLPAVPAASAGAALVARGRPRGPAAEAAPRQVDLDDEPQLREALQVAPDDPVLWANLGRLLRRRGADREAVDCYRRAAAHPQAPAAMVFNLANALTDLGHHQEALQACDDALAREPAMPQAWLLRARALKALGRLEAARDAYADIVRGDDKAFSAWLELGNVCRQLGDAARAAECHARAAQCRPEDPRGHLAAARALEAIGRHDDAAVHYHRALTACAGKAPEVAEMHHQMGRFRLDAGDAPRALEALRQASMAARLAGEAMGTDAMCEIRIDLADALMRLGMAEPARGVMQQASTATAEATLVRLAQMAMRCNEWQGAIEVLRRNVQLHPDSARAHFNLAHMLGEASQLEEALAQLARAEALSDAPLPGADALRGTIAGRTGDADQALALYRQRAHGPDADRMRSSAAMSALYSDALTPAQVAGLHRELFAPLADGARPRADFANPRTTGRPLRVGLVTGDLHHQHPVNVFMQPLLARWEHDRLPLTVYFTGDSRDDQTALARSRCDAWREATHLTAEQMARAVADDGIDLLIDLAGHTAGQRVAMFARRMAPVQVGFLGYPGSTGVPNMDWLIGDPVVTPAQDDDLCLERVWRLPHTVFCFAPGATYPLPRRSAAAAERPLTFGSFNNVAKITPRTVRLWARVLQAVPGSRLLLKAPSFADAMAQRRYQGLFAQQGVEASRLTFRGPSPLHEMMAEYGEVDIALDPVPYNGGTTTMQALWQGVPVIALRGGHFVSRMGASFLTAAGLPEWVAEDEDGYVEIARHMAADRRGLLMLQRGLREQLRARPAWDIDAYAADFAAALRGMWAAWCEEGARPLAEPTTPAERVGQIIEGDVLAVNWSEIRE